MYKPKAKEKIKLTTTLTLLQKHGACESGYKKLRKHLGARYPDDKPINLLVILKNNGVQDMLWCIRATVEPYSDHWKFLCNMYADFAESVLPIYEKFDPVGRAAHNAIKATRFGNPETARAAARAAEAAAEAAEAAEAAGAAARAAEAAAWAAEAAEAAARAAARAARAARAAEAAGAAGAAELKKQTAIIRRYLK